MITVDFSGIRNVQRSLNQMATRHQGLFLQALKEVGVVVQAAAVRRAPKSPTKQQYLRELNLKRLARLVQGKKGRKSQSTTTRTDFNPGGLERSITERVSRAGLYAEIFVPVNSEAGQYGFTMHESKYKLGAGSRDKQRGGIKIGRKYLERAAEDSDRDIFEILESYVDDMVRIENART